MADLVRVVPVERFLVWSGLGVAICAQVAFGFEELVDPALVVFREETRIGFMPSESILERVNVGDWDSYQRRSDVLLIPGVHGFFLGRIHRG